MKLNWKSPARNLLKNTIGNLTLLTHSLNPAISNNSWEIKRPEIVKYSKSNLNRYFQIEAEDSVGEWNEESILERTALLADLFVEVWQAPLAKPRDLNDDKVEDVYLAIDV